MPTVGWALQHQLAMRNNTSQTWPQASLIEAIPQLRVSLPSYVQICIKKTKI